MSEISSTNGSLRNNFNTASSAVKDTSGSSFVNNTSNLTLQVQLTEVSENSQNSLDKSMVETLKPSLSNPDPSVSTDSYIGAQEEINGLVDSKSLQTTINNALFAIANMSIDERKGIRKQMEANQLAMSGVFDLQKEEIMSQAFFQRAQSTQKASSDMNSAITSETLAVVMVVLSVITGGAALALAPVTGGASLAAEGAIVGGEEALLQAGSQVAQEGVKEGLKSVVKNSAQNIVGNMGKPLSDEAIEALAKDCMSTLKQSVISGPEMTLNNKLLGAFQKPLADTLKAGIKKGLPKALQERIEKDAAASLERQAERAAKGPLSKTEKIKEKVKDWGRVDTNEILDGICNFAAEKAIREGVDTLKYKDPDKDSGIMYDTLAQASKKVAETLGDSAQQASQTLQTVLESSDQVTKTIRDTQELLGQVIAAQNQGQSSIIKSI